MHGPSVEVPAPQRNLLPLLKVQVAAKGNSFSESPGMAQACATLVALISLSSLPGEHISLFCRCCCKSGPLRFGKNEAVHQSTECLNMRFIISMVGFIFDAGRKEQETWIFVEIAGRF